MKFLILTVFCIAYSSALRIYIRPDFGPIRGKPIIPTVIGINPFFPHRPSFGNSHFGAHRPIVFPHFPPSQNKPCGGKVSTTVSPIQSTTDEILADSTPNGLETSSSVFESTTGPVEVTTSSYDSSSQESSTPEVFESSSSSNFAEETTNAFSESTVNVNDQETSSNSNSADETRNADTVTSEDVTTAQSTIEERTTANSEINTTTIQPTVPPTKKGWFKWIKDKVSDVFG